jgi:N6-L-threonylcarbamoyladenine synthase
LVAGGVAANASLRESFAALAGTSRLIVPKLIYCTDNAAMIGAAGYWAYRRGERAGLDLDVLARDPIAERV